MGTREPWTAPHFFFKSELPCWCHHCAACRSSVSLVGNFFLRTTRALFRRFGVAVPLINPLPNKVTLYMSPGLQSGCWRLNMRMAFQYHWDSKLNEHACSQRQEVGSTCWDSCSCCRSGGDSAVTDWLTYLLTDRPRSQTARTRWSTRSLQSCWAEDLKIWFSELGHFSHGRGCPPSHSMWLLVCAGSCMVGILELDEPWGFWLVVATFDWNESRVCWVLW